MATISTPVIFCNAMPACGIITIPFPFGMPPWVTPDPCCKGLPLTLDQLDNILKPLYPFLQLIDCAVKAVDIVLGIPQAMGPPPKPGKIIALVSKVKTFTTKCLPYFISLTPVGAAIDIAKMIRGILQLLISVLNCLKRIITVHISVEADALLLGQSEDPFLREMGICLQAQADLLGEAIVSKIGALVNVFNIINLIIGLVPPLVAALTASDPPLYPIQPNMGGGVPTNTDAIDALIAVLGVVYTVVNIVAGGS